MEGPVIRHLAVLAGYLVAGIAVTWPRATYLVAGKLPATRDAGSYVWDFWWMLHQVEHLGNPWFTRSIAAPVGSQLGYHALMPLEGMLMLPITLVFGPSASYNLLSLLMPGLLCYAAYRAARLWLRSEAGAIGAGAFYGLSTDLAWHAWYQLNLAAGMLFLPLALEAAVRLRRRPGWRQSIVLGVVLGASLLTDQESAVFAVVVAVGALLPWLLRRDPGGRGSEDGEGTGPPGLMRKLGAVGAAAAVAVVVSSPQIVAMAAEARSGGATYPLRLIAHYYPHYSTSLPGVFSISPRAIQFGLTPLKAASYQGLATDGVPTYGLVLTVLAVLGLAVSWRRRNAWWLAALWLGATVLALGPTLQIGSHIYVPVADTWHGVRVSALMPYTWFVQVPGMSGFREAGRMVMLGLLPASLLAGAAIDWLRYHMTWLLVPVALIALLEAGWVGSHRGEMRTALPALDRPIAADHSGSLVVDVPWGVRGGVPLPGEGARFNPEAQVLATADGHPRAIGYVSRLPLQVPAQLQRNAFYAGLQAAQGSQPVSDVEALTGTHSYPELIAAARAQARRLDVGWVIVWPAHARHSNWPTLARHSVMKYLAETGFRVSYRADGALVYRPASAAAG